MNTLDAIRNRRSVKQYDPSHAMSEGEIRQLLELAMLSPTAFNIQHWRFVRVKDPELRKQIRAAAWDQAQVTDASALFVICGNTQAWAEEPGKYWRNAPAPVREFLVPAIQQYYEGRDQVQRDEVMRSAGFAGQTIMLAAKAMGYDSCPMDGFDFEKVAELIQLPEGYLICFMIAVGKAIQPAWPRPGQLPFEEVVVTDRFS